MTETKENISPQKQVTRIILFPGLASDNRVFSGLDGWQEYEYVDYRTLDFNNTELNVVTKILKTYNITIENLLVGTSFGGILATRISNIVGCKVILYGGLANLSEVSLFFRSLSFLSRIPLPHLRYLPRILINKYFGIRNDQEYQMFIEMANQFTMDKICEILLFVLRVKECKIIPIERFHGKFDKIVTNPKGLSFMVNGGHILTMGNHYRPKQPSSES